MRGLDDSVWSHNSEPGRNCTLFVRGLVESLHFNVARLPNIRCEKVPLWVEGEFAATTVRMAPL
jgi:hypothetical protein